MIRLRYFAPAFKLTGYAQAAQDYLMALLETGLVDLDIRPIVEPTEEDLKRLDKRYEKLLPYINRPDTEDSAWPTHVIAHSIPYGCSLFVDPQNKLAPPAHAKKIAITTWETSFLPVDAGTRLTGIFDQVWVPSYFCVDSLKSCPTIDPSKVFRVPHTFDPAHWGQTETERDKNDPYTFYTLLTWCERKNPIGLLKAYVSEFTEKDNVLLKIRTPGYYAAEVEELVRGMGLDYLPPVDMLCEHFDEDAMMRLHTTSDCYVTVARSEGWGLGAFEAALVGNPVIAPNYSGLKDFLDLYSGTLYVPHFMTPAYTPETQSARKVQAGGLTFTPVLRNDHIGIRGDQEWAEPDLGSTKQLMRLAYNRRYGKAFSNRETFIREFSYKAIGNLMVQLLEKD